jgi:cytochrome P450
VGRVPEEGITLPTQTRPACEFDVLDRGFYLDPHPAYARLRETTPISWDEKHELWVLTRHEDITYVSTHADTFCSGQGVRPTQSVDLSIIGLDGERHIRQRRLLNQGFSPRMIRALEPRVRQVVNEVLDAVADRWSTSVGPPARRATTHPPTSSPRWWEPMRTACSSRATS